MSHPNTIEALLKVDKGAIVAPCPPPATLKIIGNDLRRHKPMSTANLAELFRRG